MIKAIEKEGGKPIYTEYSDLGHLIWTQTYANSELWKWIFNQSKK
jgi:predicted peptidase